MISLLDLNVGLTKQISVTFGFAGFLFTAPMNVSGCDLSENEQQIEVAQQRVQVQPSEHKIVDRAQEHQGLVVELSVEAELLVSNKVVVVSKIIDDSAEALNILRYNSPVDISVYGDIFSIHEAGNGSRRLPYIGRLAKRAAPSVKDFISLSPGGSYSSRLDITSSYKFCGNALYSLSFARELVDDQNLSVRYKSNKIKFKLPATKIGSTAC